MAFTTPSPYFFACFPLQEYFVNKDTGFPLAAGVVEFFSDSAFTVPKDVYQQNQSGSAGNYTYSYVNLGSKLILSSVGTFADNNGNDIIPFLYPFTGTPPETSTERPTGTVQLYFIRVWNKDPSIYNDAVLQFTRSGWPPNFGNIGQFNNDFISTGNMYSNSQFSEVSFTPDPITTVYTYTVTGQVTLDIAPGWTLSASTGSTGDIRLKQIGLNTTALSEPAYAIQVDTDITITQLKLIQKINQSPRVLYNQIVSAFLQARCLNNISVPVTTTYVPSSGTSTLILQGSTTDNGEFTEIFGVNDLSVYIGGTANTQPPSTGYVELVTEFQSGRTMQFTTFQAVTVLDFNSVVPYIEQSTPQLTNGLYWYDKPHLEYKPIPSYTLGWDFAMNPFQAQGTGNALYNITGPGKSFYVADQTILFQSVVNNTTVSQVNNRSLSLAVAGNATSLALIQYLDVNEAQELLTGPVCSQLKAKISTGTLVGRVSLYYTQDASLPVLGTDKTANCYSLVSAVDNTTSKPTIGGASHGTWTELNRNNLGAASFALTTTSTAYSFNGWDQSTDANIANAKFFAIVVSFAEIPVGSTVEIDYISLQKGYIPTPPAALSFGETLTGLQQYYEKSYNLETLPGAVTYSGLNPPGFTTTDAPCIYYSQTEISLGGGIKATARPTAFSIGYKTSKRKAIIPTIYDPTALNTSNAFYSQLIIEGVKSNAASIPNISTSMTISSGQNQASYTPNSNAPYASYGPGAGTYASSYIALHWVADARFGIV